MDIAVLVGLPGAGKSSFFRAHLAATHALVSRDLFRNNRDPGRRQRTLIEQALGERRSVAVDNTNVALADRAAIVEIARRYGVAAVGYFFPPDLERSLARNAAREGRARVPEVAIFAARRRLVAPTHGEGFVALFEVDARGGAFHLRPLAPPSGRDS